MEDKMIEIARFQLAANAEMLASLLQSEGINCYVRDGLSSNLLFGKEMGRAKVELLEKDALRATEIMKDHGYEIPEGLIESFSSENLPQENPDYERSKKRLSKTMTIIIVLIVLLFGLLVFLNKYFKGEL
jgi:hypothetical protein